MSYGPWSQSLHSGERVAQLRSLAALCAMSFGSEHPIVSSLRLAESDPSALRRAYEAFELLPPLPRRHVLSTFAAVTYRGCA
jgi:hypothetical protein